MTDEACELPRPLALTRKPPSSSTPGVKPTGVHYKVGMYGVLLARSEVHRHDRPPLGNTYGMAHGVRTVAQRPWIAERAVHQSVSPVSTEYIS